MCNGVPVRIALLIGASLLSGGCASLLPEAKSTEKSIWQSYEEAEATMGMVVPRRTKLEDLRLMGFDPQLDANVATLNYSDILRRFAPGGEAGGLQADKGVRGCLSQPADCTGLEINVSGEHRERVGSFWPDFLNFRREWRTTGWRFNAIILLKNDVVVYRTWGGKPNIDKMERTNNPLGPLQGLGERAANF
ncbi:hypothetical protein [Chitinimonas naiadis]